MKIVFIVSRVPWPLEKGDKLRAFNHMKLLAENHEVTVIALNDTKLVHGYREKLEHYCKKLYVIDISWLNRITGLITAAYNGNPFSTGYFYNKATEKKIQAVINEIKPDHIFCQLTRVTEYVKNIKGVIKTLDYQDAFARGMEKRIAKEPFYKSWLFKMEYRRLLAYEAKMFDYFTNKIIISSQDREYIAHPGNKEIIVIPNGVDLDFFKPLTGTRKYDLLFTGNMAYPPNVESVVFIVNEVLPLVKQKIPGIKLLIAGANPVSRVKALESKNVVVSGWVDDMRECYADAKLFIAPMQISIGLQNKLLEAMAMQLPCITSELANNALGGTHNENIIVCSKPAEYADAIFKLLEDPAAADALAQSGYEFVKTNYSWEKMTEPLLKLFNA